MDRPHKVHPYVDTFHICAKNIAHAHNSQWDNACMVKEEEDLMSSSDEIMLLSWQIFAAIHGTSVHIYKKKYFTPRYACLI